MLVFNKSKRTLVQSSPVSCCSFSSFLHLFAGLDRGVASATCSSQHTWKLSYLFSGIQKAKWNLHSEVPLNLSPFLLNHLPDFYSSTLYLHCQQIAARCGLSITVAHSAVWILQLWMWCSTPVLSLQTLTGVLETSHVPNLLSGVGPFSIICLHFP